MMNSSLGDLNTAQNYYENNNIRVSYEYEEEITPSLLGWTALRGITLIITCIGFVGNGYIIWLLGFQIKRNCFITFILNLTIADSGYLISIFIYIIVTFTDFQGSSIFYYIFPFFFHMLYISANFLLTAIISDRCVAVLFPIWHRCSRPKHLSSTVCVLLWISSFLLSGIMMIMKVFVNYSLPDFHFLLSAIICLPLITISTMVLFIKVCVKPKHKNKGRLLLLILIALLCFLILAFLFSVLAVIIRFFSIQFNLDRLYWCGGIKMCSCLNSSINPVISFLVGRKKGEHEGHFAKDLQRRRNCWRETEELKPTCKTSVLPSE